VVRQLLTETLLLALIGSGLGVFAAYWLAAALLPALALSEPLGVDTGLHWRGLLFVALLVTVASALVGLVPALRATDVQVASGLQEGGRGADAGAGRERLSRSLVVVQVALSTVLLTAAGLLVYTVRSLQTIDSGFNPEGVLIFRMNAQLNGYEGQRARDFYSAAVERLSALPGVGGASLSSHTLIANSSAIGVARPAAAPAPPIGSEEAQEFMRRNRSWRLVIDGRFFETMGVPFLQGRTFSSGDSMSAQKVAIVNRSLAQQLFATTDVLGRRLVLGLRQDAPEYEIVGIVADARYTSLRREPPPTVYLHYAQEPITRATFAVRTAGDPVSMAGAVRDAMRALDATVPVTDMRTQDEQIRLSLQQERLFAQLSTLLGSVTLVLSAIGLYGLLAYSVSRRTAEIGIRMALGAERSAVRWMVMRQALILAGAGLLLGGVTARAGTSLIESLLFGLTATDPAALAVAAAVMLAVSVAAAYLPARRASRINPVLALRA
jgi:predicted permease